MAKQQYYSDKINECQGDRRKLFELIKSLSKAKEKIQCPASASREKLANDFNDYFVTKIKAIRVELDAIDVEKTPSEYLKDCKPTRKLCDFEPLSENQVREITKKSPNKQCASDPLPTWMLKELLDIILPFITEMVNLSLRTGYFADAWKEALIGPLLKGAGFEIIFPNFRPVSNLSFISKLVGRVTVKQTLSHMNLSCPLPICQSAYREHHSTETALLKVTSDMLLDMDDNKVTLLVMLDLSAAFDTIDRAILLETLQKKVGVSGKALDWFCPTSVTGISGCKFKENYQIE